MSEPVTLRGLVEARARASGNQTAVIVCDQAMTYAELDGRANQAANLLRALHVGRGDKVAVMLPNCWEFVALWAGVAKLGAVLVPVNVHQRGDGLAYVLEHSDAVALVVDQAIEEAVDRAGAPRLRRLVRGGDLGARLDEASTSAPPPVDIDPAAVFGLLYTSGTTGRSKGVLLSHAAYLNSGRVLATVLGVRDDDVFFTPLPLFHVGAQIVVMMPALWAGRPVVAADGFSARTYWDTVRRYRCTLLHYLGSVLNILLKQPPRPDDAHTPGRLMFGGGAAKTIWREFEQRFGVTMCEGYGLTESAGIVTFNAPEAIRLGSIGREVAHGEVRVLDEQDRAVPPGAIGEIAMRPRVAHVIMDGYYKDTEATARTLRGGWLHTGDRGSMDEDGYVYFVDRLKDSIRRRGENVSSFEVEQVINAHPKVLESVAVGVPDALGDEEIKVIVVLRPGERLDALAIVQWVEARMAYFMVPRYVEFRDALPKTDTQKILKTALRQEGVGAAWDREAAGYRVRRRSSGNDAGQRPIGGRT
jgi:carnitine-CoA ligase